MCGTPKHTRRTCPKFTIFGVSAPLNSEMLQCFEEKSPELLHTNSTFYVHAIMPAIPKDWHHVVIVDDFLATLPQGFLRVCEVVGLNQIGDVIPGKQSFVRVETLRQRFQLNMSKPQAKKIMILAIRTAHSCGEIETNGRR